MFDAGREFNEEIIEYTPSTASIDDSAFERITHAPLVIPHISSDVPLNIAFEGNLLSCMTICDGLEDKGLFTQEALNKHDSVAGALEAQIEELFSGLKKFDVDVVLKEDHRGREGKHIIEVDAFKESIGFIYIGDAVAELNAVEDGLGGLFTKLLFNTCGRLFRGWSQVDCWEFIFNNEWRGNDSYADFIEEITAEMDGELDIEEFEVISEEDALEGLGGRYKDFVILYDSKEAFFQSIKEKLPLFGKYSALVKAMLKVEKEVEHGVSHFSQQYNETVESYWEEGYGCEELFISSVRSPLYTHCHDQHLQHLYESSDDANERAMGWRLDNIDGEAIKLEVEILQRLLTSRKSFKKQLLKVFKPET
jgi:hypothetical protein